MLNGYLQGYSEKESKGTFAGMKIIMIKKSFLSYKKGKNTKANITGEIRKLRCCPQRKICRKMFETVYI